MIDDDRPLTTDAQIRDHVAGLIGPAIRPQCWLMFLEHDDRPINLLMPCDDVPVDPDPEDLALFARFVRMVIEKEDAGAVIVVWERPGGPELRMQEAGWVEGVAFAGLPLRAQLLAYDDDVRVIDVAAELAADLAA